MNRVLILGGGFGGLAAAHQLRRLLAPEDEIVLVDRGREFMVGFRKTWALVGMSPLEEGRGDRQALEAAGIRFIQGEIDFVDPAGRAAQVEGSRLEADALIVALGAELAGDAVPGFEEYVLNVYDSQSIPAAEEKIKHFNGGRVMVGIFGEPYKCPPAPYELALLLRDHFEQRGLDARMEVFTPKPMSLPILGDAGCSVIEGRLDDSGIAFLPNHKAVRVEADRVLFTTTRRPYDLLLGVPPHRCPQVLVDAGLTGDEGWVAVQPETLETSFPGVYAIGDATKITLADGKPHPKAGIFAERQGEVVADRIAAAFQERAPQAVYTGDGYCFLEVGGGEAMLVQGRFLAEPAPEVELTEPSAEAMAQKYAFETERLRAWFGEPEPST